MKTVILSAPQGLYNLFAVSESEVWKVFKDQIFRCLFAIKKSSRREKTKERIPVRDERSQHWKEAVFQGGPMTLENCEDAGASGFSTSLTVDL